MPIPKKIHYCWFGGKKLPRHAEKCIASWRKFFPGFEIIKWDETNFDHNLTSYTSQSYAAKKYAFVSDFARFWILYNHGGLYFDTDVEVIKPMDDILAEGSFMGCEPEDDTIDLGVNFAVAPGLGMATEKGNSLFKYILDKYSQIEFRRKDGTYNTKTVAWHVTNMLKILGLKDQNCIQTIKGVRIYPPEYFCPKSTRDGKIRITPNTRTIHYYNQSWQSPVIRLGRKVVLLIGGYKLKRIIKKAFFNSL